MFYGKYESIDDFPAIGQGHNGGPAGNEKLAETSSQKILIELDKFHNRGQSSYETMINIQKIFDK
jgi:hypothetical protein